MNNLQNFMYYSAIALVDLFVAGSFVLLFTAAVVGIVRTSIKTIAQGYFTEYESMMRRMASERVTFGVPN